MGKKQLLKFKLFIICFITCSPLLFSQSNWITMAPGGGGQIQDIYLDPDTPNKLWLSSDMEGCYVSNNLGDSWEFIGRDLSHGMAFKIRKSPNGNLLQGSLWGAHISTNNGENWTLIPETKADAIATIAFNTDGSTIVLGPSWLTKDPQKIQPSISDPLQQLTGERYIYLSQDGGSTFTKIVYETTPGYYQVYNAFIHPVTSLIYLGTASGLYVSTDASGTAFNRIPNPSDAYLGEDAGIQTMTVYKSDGITIDPNGYKFSGGLSGLGASPDGSRLYATFQTGNRNWAIYTIKTSNMSASTPEWVKVSDNLSDKPQWFNPTVDPRSTATSHKVLVGTVFLGRENRVGLFEGTINFDASGNVTTNSWQQVLSKGGDFKFEEGWENASLISRTYGYTPVSWPERRIISGGGNNYFYSNDPAASGWPYNEDSWLPIYTKKSTESFGPEHTWYSTGFANTVSYDVDSYGNYAIQGNADQGILESWDYGKSWTKNTVPRGITNAQSVAITHTSTPIVLMDTRPGYGIASLTIGKFYARKLTDLTTQPESSDWRLIGGGSDKSNIINGLPNRQVQGIALDELHPSRVYLGLRSTYSVGGIFATEDIEAVYNNEANWVEISTPGMRNISSFNDIFVDPNNSNVIWASGKDIYKGTRTAPNTWSWEMYDTTIQDMYVWDDNGTTRVAVALTNSSNTEVFLLQDPDQAGWNSESRFIGTGLTIEETLNIRPQVWVEPNETIAFGLMAGYKDQIFVGTENSKHKKGLGVFKGTISSLTQVDWVDFSTDDQGHDLIYSRDAGSDSKIIKEINGDVNYYIPTFGTGVYKRLIDTGVMETAVKVDKSALRFTSIINSENTLTIESTTSWNLTNLPSWLSSNTVSGTGDATITFTTTEANTSPQNRIATVKLNAGSKQIEILVTQTGTPIPINFVDTPIGIDGIQDDQWDAITWQNIDANLFGTTTDTRDKFKLAYTRDKLYILVRVQDATINKGSDVMADHIQLALDINNDKKSIIGDSDYQFVITSDNTVINLQGMLNNTESAAKTIAAGYVYEIAIPWDDLGTIPVNLTELGFEIQIADNQQGSDVDQANQWFSDVNLTDNNPFSWGTAALNGPDVPWLETFDLVPNSTEDLGYTAWSIDFGNTDLADENDYVKVTDDGILEARDIDGVAIFKTEVIDISQISKVRVRLDAKEKGDNFREEESNFIKLYVILDGGEPQLVDQLVGDSPEDDMFVELSTNGLEGNSIQVLVEISNDRGGTFHAIDNLLIDFGQDEVCNAPTALNVDSITYSAVILSWDFELDGINTFQLEIKETGSGVWESAEIQNQLNHQFDNLIPETTYEWRVRQNCITGTSSWVNGDNFTTPIQPILSSVFSETFDETGCSPSNDATVDSYECYNNPTSYYSGNTGFDDKSNDGTYEGASNGHHIFLTEVDQTFEINGINTIGYTGTSFQFSVRKNGNNQDGSDLKLEITTDGVNWNRIDVILPKGTDTALLWYLIKPDVMIEETSNFGIRFTAEGSSKYKIDDIRVRGEEFSEDESDDTTLDIKSINKSTGLSLYPNPVTTSLRINAQNTTLNSVSIFNSKGQMIQNIISNTKQNSILDVNTAHWDQGVYILKIQTDTEVKIYKIIKK
ncbi:sugar-binding protein [Tamlana sp. I1]|uniref:sugar-binding protein n=1 Tax=Tamlana sp. I1 TaxID=2762061 RepID=UPI00188F88DD|nr:sugar-binding protein [Tamlana sp. I1]